ncbi:MAG: VCBS repeat-containing protein [Planctomycetes bacterium]|nr:VCBS repeat-containing protein [Planctomycetota bacterium]
MVTLHQPAPDAPIAIATADLDGDGNDEIITTSYDGSIVIRSADGLQQIRRPSVDKKRPRFLTVHDLNGDGRADVLYCEDSGRLCAIYATGLLAWPK